MKKTLVLGILVLGACCCFLFRHPVFAQAPNPIVFTVNGNCDNDPHTPHQWCTFLHTQIRLGASRDPFDQWNLIVEAPAPVKKVTCYYTGPNEFHYLQYKEANKPQTVAGEIYGNNGICRGWINGGKAPVSITVAY
jgi:hypothetical protein